MIELTSWARRGSLCTPAGTIRCIVSSDSRRTAILCFALRSGKWDRLPRSSVDFLRWTDRRKGPWPAGCPTEGAAERPLILDGGMWNVHLRNKRIGWICSGVPAWLESLNHNSIFYWQFVTNKSVVFFLSINYAVKQYSKIFVGSSSELCIQKYIENTIKQYVFDTDFPLFCNPCSYSSFELQKLFFYCTLFHFRSFFNENWFPNKQNFQKKCCSTWNVNINHDFL